MAMLTRLNHTSTLSFTLLSKSLNSTTLTALSCVVLCPSQTHQKQPGPITRLFSCTDEEKKNYKRMHLAPTFEVPSMSRHPKTGDWYPAINKPAGVIHCFKYNKDAINVDWVLILDTDMIIRGQIHVPIYVTNAEIAVLGSDLGSDETQKTLDLAGTVVVSLSANHLQKLRFSFQLTTTYH
ncbi:unnamed protein product [Lathyrus oleraceus]